MYPFKKIDEMWNTGKFEISLAIANGKFLPELDLVCITEECHSCSLAILEDYNMYSCPYNDISGRNIMKYLIENKPKAVITRIRQCPKETVDYWITKLQENFPLDEFPEYYV